MNRRQFLAAFAAGAVMTAEGLWLPGRKLISIPKVRDVSWYVDGEWLVIPPNGELPLNARGWSNGQERMIDVRERDGRWTRYTIDKYGGSTATTIETLGIPQAPSYVASITFPLYEAQEVI